VALAAASVHLRGRVLRVHAVARTAVRCSDASGERQNRRVFALVELRFLRRVTASAKCRYLLWSGDAIRSSSTGSFTMFYARAMAGIAAQGPGCMGMLQKIGDLLGMAGLAEGVHRLGVCGEHQCQQEK
jgi:hypothetical protein